MEVMGSRRFCFLDIARFAFTMMIAVFHYWSSYEVNCRGGFIAVEFFFILSGFMLMEQAAGPQGKMTPGQFLIARVKKYYPHYIFSFTVIFLAKNIIYNRTALTQLPSLLIRQTAEIFMLHGTILSDENTALYNSMTWYLSVLLVVGYILWAFLKRHKEALITAAPVVSFWIYAYMAYTVKSTNIWRTHVFSVFDYGLLRGVAGMLLGVLVWHWYCLVRDRAKGKIIQGGVLCSLGTAALATAFAASYIWYDMSSFLYVALFAVGIVLLSAGERLGVRLPKAGQTAAVWMSRISWGIYLNHYLVKDVCKFFIPDYRPSILPLYLVGLIVYSVFTTAAVGYIMRLFRRTKAVAPGKTEAAL